MAVTELFKEFAKKQDVLNIRIMMKNSLLIDSTFEDFKEMEQLTQHIKTLYDVHDGSVLSYEKSDWTKDYMNQKMVQVVDNFSHERIKHLQAIVSYLYPVPKKQSFQDIRYAKNMPRLNPNSSETAYQAGKRRDAKKGRIIRMQRIALGSVVGGVIGGGIATVAGGTALVGTAAGAAAGAVTAVVVNNHNRRR